MSTPPINFAELAKKHKGAAHTAPIDKYRNPEDQPPATSFAFNKQWSKPGPYVTKLTPQDEAAFQQWAKQNPDLVHGELDTPTPDYDVRGRWLAEKHGDPAAKLTRSKFDGKLHANDKWKTPYDATFSRESIYALPNAPSWQGDKLVTHDGRLVVDETPKKQAPVGKKEVTQVQPRQDNSEHFPPELSRLVGSLNPQFVKGKPLPDGGIASVGEHEPRRVEINDPVKFSQDPTQVKAHELTHIWANNLPGKLQQQIPPDNPRDPYNISTLDALRKNGVTFLHLPREMQATILQTWTAKPSERKRLQPWLDDMGKTPLAIMMPTDSSSKELNRKVRPPLPPLDSFKSNR